MSLLRERCERFEREALALTGWPPSYPPEFLDPEASWDYQGLARDAARDASRLLDIGTGGGEVLGRILEATGAAAVALEEWHVNAPVAARALAGRATVTRAAWHQLPFRDGCFDLVLSRHTAISPTEVARVASATSRVLTQQVGPDNWSELGEFFPDRTCYPRHDRAYPAELEGAGFEVRTLVRHQRRGRYTDPAHIAYLLTACPWEVPGFSVATHLDALEAVSQHMRRHGGLVLTYTLYLLDAAR